MSKYCQNCGAVLEDDAMFCPQCGANFGANAQEAAAPAAPAVPVEAQQPQQPQQPQPAVPYAAAPQQAYTQPQQPEAAPYGAPQEAPAEPKKGPKKGMIFGIGGGAAALIVILIVLIIVISSGSGAKGAFKKGFNALKDDNIQKAADIYYETNFSNSMTKEEYVAQAEKSRESDPELYEEQKEKRKTASYNNLTIRKLDAQEEAKLKETLAEQYNDVGNIKEIDKLYYNYVYDNSSGSSSCYAIKVGSKWYLYGVGF